MIFSKMHNFFTAAFVVAVSLFLFSCNDEPTPVGYALVNDTLSFHNLSSTEDGLIVSFESDYKPTLQRNYESFFVGKAHGVSAASLLRFDRSLPDSLLDFITVDDIRSIKLKLTPYRYVLGDSTNILQDINIYQLNSWWEFGLTWDSVFTGNTPTHLVESEITANPQLEIHLQDSMSQVEIDLTSDKFKADYLRWLEDDRDTTRPLSNWGLLLAPSDNSDHISSFISQTLKDQEDTNPELEIIYDHKDGRIDTIVTKSNIEAYITKLEDTDQGKLSMMVNAEIVSKLSLDVRAIPQRAGIHKSYLEFKLDKENTVLGNMPMDSILLVQIIMDGEVSKENPLKIDSNGVARLEYMQHAIEYLKSTGGMGDITVTIDASHGNAAKKLDRLRFFGMDAEDPEMRPKLNIVYSMIVDKNNGK